MSGMHTGFKDSDRESGKSRLPGTGPFPRGSTPRKGRRRYLAALPLVAFACLLLLGLAFRWQGGNGKQAKRPATGAGSEQIQKTAAGNPSTSSPGKANVGSGFQDAEMNRAPLVDRSPPTGTQAVSASPGGNVTGQTPVAADDLPSAQRARAILAERTSGSARGPTVIPEGDGTQANPRRGRSAARSVALADVSERLPPSYFNRETGSQPAPTGTAGSSSRWPVSVGTGQSAGLPGKPGAVSGGAEQPLGGKAAVSGETLRYSDIPPQIRNSVPMSISMIGYSKQPDDRWATINGQRMREGGQMASGLQVKEITPDGVVFNYQGHSFYKAVREE